MPNITAETRVLLAVLAAASTSDRDSEVRRVLDRKLGAGWSLDLLNARSDDERVGVLTRRLRLVGDYRTSFDNVQDQTAHEDGGAR